MDETGWAHDRRVDVTIPQTAPEESITGTHPQSRSHMSCAALLKHVFSAACGNVARHHVPNFHRVGLGLATLQIARSLQSDAAQTPREARSKPAMDGYGESILPHVARLCREGGGLRQ